MTVDTRRLSAFARSPLKVGLRRGGTGTERRVSGSRGWGQFRSGTERPIFASGRRPPDPSQCAPTKRSSSSATGSAGSGRLPATTTSWSPTTSRFARPLLALAAGGCERPLAHPRYERLRVERRRLGRGRARRPRDLRAPRRHIQRGGNFDGIVPQLRDPARARRDGDRADAGRHLSRQPRLGLRRPLHVRRRTPRTAARRARPPRRRGARRGARRDPRRRLQPRRPRQRSARARSAPTSPTGTRRSGATRSTTRSAACGNGRSRMPSSGCATSTSTACASTRCTRSSTTRRSTSARS